MERQSTEEYGREKPGSILGAGPLMYRELFSYFALAYRKLESVGCTIFILAV